MSNLTVWDHVFALLVFVAFPTYSTILFPRILSDIRKRGEPARIAIYREIVGTWLVFAICLFVMWVLLEREWADLGIRPAAAIPLGAGFAVAAIFSVAVLRPLWNVSRSPERLPEYLNKVDDQLGDVILLMPRSKNEEAWFRIVSVNAGVTEELIFRGYLIWYLEKILGLWWAAAIAVFLFAFAHLYQGLRQLPVLLLTSAVFVSLYLLTGSLLLPVLLHIFLDVAQGHYIAKIQRMQASTG